jgi:anti-sigma regulatory factor (Ser/Thr protein kinase)
MLHLGGHQEPVAVGLGGQAPSVWVFAGEPETTRRVRERLRAWSQEVGLGPPTADHLVLVASELVTNVVRHCDGGVVVSVVRGAHDVLLEVGDGSPAEPHRATHRSPLATGGRGLVVVEALARSWGAGAAGSGKVVWARLPLLANA